jgi:DNA-directed RNA polymerase subunit omega (EC 2.7.7.6)
MSRRPNIEGALKQVSSRYELVHAAAKRVEQLLKEEDDIFVRDKVKKGTHKENLLCHRGTGRR